MSAVRHPVPTHFAVVHDRNALLHIYAKLGVNDRAAAVAAAYERRLLVPQRD